MLTLRRLRALSSLLLLAGLAFVLPAPGPAAADGGGDATVLSFGTAPFHGSTDAVRLNQPVVAMAATPDAGGYWLAAADGGVFAYGNAPFHGSAGGIRLNQPIVGMTATPSGDGYWMVARDGGIFSYGAARFHGSTGAIRLNQPIVGMAPTKTGRGYWLVARDGGVFAFGDAGFHGSGASLHLSRPVAGMAASAGGQGYWLVTTDGGVFSFGDAPFHGSGSGRVPPGKVVTGITRVTAGGGYWLLTGDDILVPGSLGASVEAVQRRLLELGYFVQVDGRFTEVTRQAVYALEKSAGLPRRGVVGPEERAALERGVRPWAKTRSGYVIEIDKSRQIIMAVRDGHPIWTFNTSTGNGRPYRTAGGGRAVAVTPEGRFSIQRAINGMRVSDLGQLWRPRYFTGGYAIHGSPSIPPYPASHGCARLHNAAIDFVWAANIMPIGVPVWVYS